jgi:hypothetical protein
MTDHVTHQPSFLYSIKESRLLSSKLRHHKILYMHINVSEEHIASLIRVEGLNTDSTKP